jgi:hypothetical protein
MGPYSITHTNECLFHMLTGSDAIKIEQGLMGYPKYYVTFKIIIILKFNNNCIKFNGNYIE